MYIILALPAVNAVANPVIESIDKTVGSLLLHFPPTGVAAIVAVAPIQVGADPVVLIVGVAGGVSNETTSDDVKIQSVAVVTSTE